MIVDFESIIKQLKELSKSGLVKSVIIQNPKFKTSAVMKLDLPKLIFDSPTEKIQVWKAENTYKEVQVKEEIKCNHVLEEYKIQL